MLVKFGSHLIWVFLFQNVPALFSHQWLVSVWNSPMFSISWTWAYFTSVLQKFSYKILFRYLKYYNFFYTIITIWHFGRKPLKTFVAPSKYDENCELYKSNTLVERLCLRTEKNISLKRRYFHTFIIFQYRNS